MSTIEREEVDDSGIRNRIRVNVTKNTKGYTFERTVEVEWDGNPQAGAKRLTELLATTAEIARNDIENQRRIDATRGE